MKSILWRIWGVARWPLAVLVILYIAIVIYSFPHALEKEKTEETIARINAQKLTIENVNGEHLPPPPDPAQVDATIEGVDANANGIRDDVELAIFERYPNSAKIRAAELQYAMALQMALTEVFNSETWIAVTQEKGRGFGCIYDSVVDDDPHLVANLREETKKLVLNVEPRSERYADLDRYRASYSVLEGSDCDLDSTSL